MADLTLVIGNKAYSSWSLRPWLLLRERGIAFKEIRIPLYQPDTPRSASASISPSGHVPLLIDGATKIWDSLAICEYVNERFPADAGWPQALEARAVARSVSAEMHSGFATVRHGAADERPRPPLRGDALRRTRARASIASSRSGATAASASAPAAASCSAASASPTRCSPRW